MTPIGDGSPDISPLLARGHLTSRTAFIRRRFWNAAERFGRPFPTQPLGFARSPARRLRIRASQEPSTDPQQPVAGHLHGLHSLLCAGPLSHAPASAIPQIRRGRTRCEHRAGCRRQAQGCPADLQKRFRMWLVLSSLGPDAAEISQSDQVSKLAKHRTRSSAGIAHQSDQAWPRSFRT
jgi:hypothetical protein